jgi:hypothetical protein
MDEMNDTSHCNRLHQNEELYYYKMLRIIAGSVVRDLAGITAK